MAKANNAPVKATAKKSGFKYTLSMYYKQRYLFIALIPAIIYYIIFHYGPMYGLTIAFKDFNFSKGIMGSEWVGFKNFALFLSTRDFRTVLSNTLIISLMQLIIGFPIPIIFALLLNEVRVKSYKRVIQTISYMPHFFSWVVLAGIFIEILSPSRGLVNVIITKLGGEPIHFMADKAWFRWVLVFSSIWKEMGWNSIIYLAALTGIDACLYEAASIDGASRMKQMYYVTIPSIMPIVSIMLIMSIGKLLNDNFDQIMNMYNSSVYSVADVISTYVYRMGLVDFKYSFATAVDVFKNVISFMLVILANTVAKKVGDYGIW